MKNSELYISEINDILGGVKFSELESQQKKDLLQNLIHEAFISVYEKDFINVEDCEEDEGFATVPALIRDAEGREYVGLIDVCVQDSGEHYGTTVFTIEGVKTQGEENGFSDYVAFPYKYKPLVKIVGDIHTSAYY